MKDSPDVLLDHAADAMARSTDTALPRELEEVNRSRAFSCRARVEALHRWLEAGDYEGPDGIAFVSALVAKRPRDAAAHVVLAQLHERSGNHLLSTATIATARGIARHDIFVSEVARAMTDRSAGRDPEELDAWLRTRHCDMPFTNFDVMPNGDVFVCCGDWLPLPIGNVNRQPAEEIWNSPVANALRASILDGSYRYCNRLSCMAIINRDLPVADVEHLRTLERPEPPSRLVLSHDNSCNLSCPSCRTHVIMARKGDQDRLDSLMESVLVPLLRHARSARISGSGDPFASQHYRSILKRVNRAEFPHLYFDLHTNGVLFDERAWIELDLADKIGSVEVSIDAATAPTYHKVRQGGDFDRLLRNLEFVQSLRERQAFGRLTFSFVVQQDNYHEMPAFVGLATRFHADVVDFRMIQNWGTSSLEEFRRRFIGHPAHPEHDEYVAVLADARLHQPAVRLPE